MIDLNLRFGTNETFIERSPGRATKEHPSLAPIQNTDEFPLAIF